MSEYKYSGLDLVDMMRYPENHGRKFVATTGSTIKITDNPAKLRWGEEAGEYDAAITARFLERRFKDTEPAYKKIDFITAMDMLNHHHRVYVKTLDGFKSVTLDTGFQCWPMHPRPTSIAEIIKHDFYKKND